MRKDTIARWFMASLLCSLIGIAGMIVEYAKTGDVYYSTMVATVIVIVAASYFFGKLIGELEGGGKE